MKKSKFLLLGSVASLASIPFVAAKCGETKEEEKKPEEGKNPSENTEPDKNPGVDKNPGGENQTESDEEPKEEVEKAYWESIMEWGQVTEEEDSVNKGIGWGENHRWGKNEEDLEAKAEQGSTGKAKAEKVQQDKVQQDKVK
ncbi:variable surface lipoprotein [Mycoplasmopsis bovis]|uniref:variable surface lipoprotein n=1 Tax=Mycoplasmopsis bovis TaxID=28903 RepID=UPI00287F6DFD|nr:variable surface lipoprotein [Mycoplasmopsis bovis]WNA91437.1 variable surface lipoprotein [Mycoplasmopsis bovis]